MISLLLYQLSLSFLFCGVDQFDFWEVFIYRRYKCLRRTQSSLCLLRAAACWRLISPSRY